MTSIRTGKHNRVPLAIGTNATEFELLLPPIVNTCLDFELYVAGTFRTFAEAVQKRYPCTSFPTPRLAAVKALTDMVFTCPARRIARAALEGHSPAVFRYYYPHDYVNNPLALMHAFHTAELSFVFDTFGAIDYRPTPGDRSLSRAMGAYWSQFARTGDPNPKAPTALPPWPRYERGEERAIVFDDTISTTSQIAESRCDFWDHVAVEN
jgi:para-nitrobenzyl esterase